ncbi:MAG: NAD(P)/FAD-dependent oxidoreductase [Atribacterota bacterium]|nr:NAD(P)/FAD-dependent oxidoreductase [Atribacterota bacterium]MDD5636927.1 NAD(P)/FAD-dependent oxidoreductase [Atribacterota bacterium]
MEYSEQNIKNKKENYFDIAVLGGGPAGMIAAGRAAELGIRVVLLERNDSLGKKLLLTGKGRCNFTHYEFDKVKLAEKFGKNGRFLYSALERFGVSEVLNFFQSRGLIWQVERGNRIFPKEGDAQDVLKILTGYLSEGRVKIYYNTRISAIEVAQDSTGICKIIFTGGEIFSEKIILCTGGKSYPQTGSTGDGYGWAEKLGHTIVKPLPALNPVKTSEIWVKEVQGLTLKNISLQLYQDGKKHDERFGELLFTHFGISGPIVMDMSNNIEQHLRKGEVKLLLDLKPALDFKKLEERIQRDFQEFKGRMFKNSLPKLLPASLIPVIIQLSNIEEDKRVDYITKSERKRLVHLLKELELTPTELLGFPWAMITCGGVSLREVDPGTMVSKKVKNLYFAGEILDLDGPSGGYNLQECWSTGFLAGESAARRSKAN